MNLEIRKLTNADRVSYDKLCSMCFMYPIDVEQSKKNAEESKYDPTGYGAFVDGEMVAGVIGNELEMTFDGKKASLVGIGGVVTHPSHRKSGAIKKIMKELLTEARKKGFVFSGLYPFNHGFYRKFGYELSRDLETYTLPFSLISQYASDVKTRMLDEKEDREILRPVYDAFISRYNLAISRDKNALSRLTASNPYAKNDYTYAIYDGDEITAYIAFTKTDKNGEGVMVIKDYAFKTEKDFIRILSFFHRFSPEFGAFEISLPSDIPLALLTNDPYSVLKSVSSRYMMRVVNCEKALGMLSRNITSPIIIEVDDPFLPENSGTFLVQEGKCEKTDLAPDISMSIQAFSQLMSGYTGIEGTVYRPDVTLYKNKEILASVFKKQGTYLGVYY